MTGRPQIDPGKRKVLRAIGWAMLDAKGNILLGSIRARADETRLAAGEGRVYPVTVFLEMDDDNYGEPQP